MSRSLGDEARVVQLQSSSGSISIELYDNFCSDVFWQLACSGQLRRLVFRQLLAGFAVLGDVSDVCARCTTAADIAGLPDGTALGGAALQHVGAGLLSCPVELGAVLCCRFLLTLAPQPKLDRTHVVFGRVYSGMSTVEEMARQQVDAEFNFYSPVSVLKCSTALLPRPSPPSAGTGVTAAAADACTAKALSSVPLVSLIE